MLRYFLEQEEPEADETTRNIIKTQLIRKREYRPFHLDCAFTKRKLCYCGQHAISKMPRENRSSLWKDYQQTQNNLDGVKPQSIKKANHIFSHCRDKIRELSRAEVAEFVRRLRSEKSLHMGQNGEYENM